MLRLLHTRAAISPCCHGNVMKWRNYATWTSSKFPHSFCEFPQFLQVPTISLQKLHKYAYFIAFFKKMCHIIKDFWPQQSQKNAAFFQRDWVYEFTSLWYRCTNPILCITTSKSHAIDTFATIIAAQLVQNTFAHPCFIIWEHAQKVCIRKPKFELMHQKLHICEKFPHK